MKATRTEVEHSAAQEVDDMHIVGIVEGGAERDDALVAARALEHVGHQLPTALATRLDVERPTEGVDELGGEEDLQEEADSAL